MFIPFFSVIGC